MWKITHLQNGNQTNDTSEKTNPEKGHRNKNKFERGQLLRISLWPLANRERKNRHMAVLKKEQSDKETTAT